MADFYQTGSISTLHRLGSPNLERLESELSEYAETQPIALVLPCLYSELEGPALESIVEHLRGVPYLKEIVIAIGRASALEFRRAKDYFKQLPQDVRLIWIDGARVQELLEVLTKSDVDIGLPGKGQSCWLSFGYVLARQQSKVIALHDCDVLTYDREFLARLCYPVGNPNLGYEFCKGYYPRVTNRLYGRVTRLFAFPLLKSLIHLIGPHPKLSFFESFRYPLAGEFAMVADLAWINKFPGDWGLEIGVLAEVHRNCADRRVCQAELTDRYDHKHQSLSSDNPEDGLLKMSIDIAKTLFRTLASDGVVLSDASLKTLRATYLQVAQETIKKYEHVAAINGLEFDRHGERTAVEVFLGGLNIATDTFSKDPLGVPMISSWNQVVAAVPDIFARLLEAVEADHTWSPTAEEVVTSEVTQDAGS
ncbi:MAG: glycosyl transferase [Nitrospirota bacterium]|nr:glycosyl transferase [Nitrospirota bacterium]